MRRAEPTDEQLQLIKRHIIIPVAISALEYDAKILRTFGLGEVYAGLVKEWQDRLFMLHYKVRAGLKEHGIKVNVLEQNKEVGIRAEYWLRGYRDRFDMIPRFIKAEIEVLIRGIQEEIAPKRRIIFDII